MKHMLMLTCLVSQFLRQLFGRRQATGDGSMNWKIVAGLTYASSSLFAGEVMHQTDSERYRYVLEQGHEIPVCSHMTAVFNAKFKTPWEKGYKTDKSSSTVFGIPYDQVFKRLPEVDFNMDFTWDMLLTRFPMSPEFETLQWQETRMVYADTPHRTGKALFTRWVPSGELRASLWIFKTTFMRRITTNEGWGDSHGGSDTLDFIDDPNFVPPFPLTSKLFSHPPDVPGTSRSLGRETASQLRPFVFDDELYIAAYQTKWKELRSGYTETLQTYPEKEYMNILRLTPERIPGKFVDLAKTETVCRIRMVMQRMNRTTGVK